MSDFSSPGSNPRSHLPSSDTTGSPAAPTRSSILSVIVALLLVGAFVGAALFIGLKLMPIFLPPADRKPPQPPVAVTPAAKNEPELASVQPEKSAPQPAHEPPATRSKSSSDKVRDDPNRLLGEGLNLDSLSSLPQSSRPELVPEDIQPLSPRLPEPKPRDPVTLLPDPMISPTTPLSPPKTKPATPPPKPQTEPTPAPPQPEATLAPPQPEPKPRPTPSEAKPKQRRRAQVMDEALEKRLALTEGELREQLKRVPELLVFTDLEIQALRAEQSLARSKPATGVSGAGINNLYNQKLHQAMAFRAMRAGLPLIGDLQSRMDEGNAEIAQNVSKELRSLGFVSVPGVPSRITRARGSTIDVPGTSLKQGSAHATIKAFEQWCDNNQVEKYNGALSTLLQMLQVEDEATRLILVREMARAPGAGTSVVLASRALLDLSPQVRRAAVAALKKRPPRDYQLVLLRGYTYPWAPVADHAAEALVTLDAKDTVPQLVGLLDKSDPTLPVLNKTTGRRSVIELVRLNHMRHCFLCHAPSSGSKDGLIRGAVPTPGEKLPPAYYQSPGTNFVRADTTFLRQDFSACLTVSNPEPWPADQRFDFLVRKRYLSPKEKPEATGPATASTKREAIEYTLRRLTGKDGGASSAKWKELLAAPVLETTKPEAAEVKKRLHIPPG